MTITSLDDFRAKEETAPNYNYLIQLKDGTEVQENGFFIINSLFIAICRGEEGVIYWARPTADFAGVKNLGVSTATLN